MNIERAWGRAGSIFTKWCGNGRKGRSRVRRGLRRAAMCPVCLMSVAAMAAGVTSSGGLTALVVRGFRSGSSTEKFRAKKEKQRRNDNGNFSYEQDRKSEGDVASAVGGGTQAVVDE